MIRDAYALMQCVYARQPLTWCMERHSHDMPYIIQASRTAGLIRFGDVSFWSRRVGKWLIRRLVGNSDRWADLEKALTAGWPSLREHLVRHRLCVVEGVSFFPLIESQLHRFFSRGVVEIERCYYAAKRLARSTKVRFLLAVHSGRLWDAVVVQALRDSGVPVIYSQEGGPHGYCEQPIHHYRELSNSDYFLAYGPGVEKYLASTKLTPRQRAHVITVGSFGLWKMRKRYETDTRIRVHCRRVMYVPSSNFSHGVRYVPLQYSYREHYKIKRQVLETLLELSDVQVIYKIPRGTGARDTCRALVGKHRDRITMCDTPLSGALDEADLILIDRPTTVLLEALTTTIPVLVLIDPIVCSPIEEAMALLRRRALLCESLDCFLNTIRNAVENPDATLKTINLSDRTFLDAYGTGGEKSWAPAQLVEFLEGVSRT